MDRNNKGFTLIELMIVLSIIGILAVVLIPKVGSMKDTTRETGVSANVSSVRALLELKVNDRTSNVRVEDDRLVLILNEEFTGGNAIVNPFTNGNSMGLGGSNSTKNEYSIVIYNYNRVFDVNTYTSLSSDIRYRGKVIIEVFTNTYIIYGIDKEGIPIMYQIVK